MADIVVLRTVKQKEKKKKQKAVEKQKDFGRNQVCPLFFCLFQQFANAFADSFCAVHTHQFKFANFSLPCEGGLIQRL